MDDVPKSRWIATVSTIGCVVNALTKTGVLRLNDVLDQMRATAAVHRERGDPLLAEHIGMIADHLEQQSREPPLPRPSGPQA